MKHPKMVGLILAILTLLLSGCGQIPEETTPSSRIPVTTETQLTAAQKYANACKVVDEASHLLLTYSVSETRNIKGAQYPKSVSGTAAYQNIHQSTMTSVVEETLKYGTYENKYKEVYCDETAYVEVSNCYFSADLTVQAFIDRQIPAILLDQGLYTSITAEPLESGTLLTFTNPVALESWLCPENTATLVSAKGTALLDSNGVLTQTTYQAEYSYLDVQYVYDVTVKVTVPKALDLSGWHPEHFENATSLSDIRVPKLLMQVVGDVYSSQSLRCEAKESIYSEAIPVSQQQLSHYQLTGNDATLSATMQYTTTLSDYRGDVSTTTQVNQFQNGVFTTSINGGTPTVQPQITSQMVRHNCEDAILSALFATKYISGASVQESPEHYRLELRGNDAFVSDFMVGITQFLKVDLDKQADSALTTEASGYVVIDRATGLPTSMGLTLNRQHTINAVPYRLNYQLEHTIALSETD